MKDLYDLLWKFYGLFSGLKPVFEGYLARGQKMRAKNGGGELVGELDLVLDAQIAGFLRQNFPGVPIISEEGGHTWPPEAREFFVVDPCDGTHLAGIEVPAFGSMVALVKNSDVVLSAIYLPFHPNGLYLAVRGGGAWQFMPNGSPRRLQVSGKENLEEAYVLLDGPTHEKFSPENEFTPAVIWNTKRKKELSSCWSGTRVASGSFLPISVEALISTGSKPCDNLPIALLVEEAGGKVTDHFGNPWSLENCSSLVFSNGCLHEKILALNQPPEVVFPFGAGIQEQLELV